MTNPWLSLWLSAANRWASAGRGLWAAELQRQQTAMMQEAIRQSLTFWSGGWMGSDRPRATAEHSRVRRRSAR